MEIGHDDAVKEAKKAIYPTPTESRNLAWGNILFWYKNWDFCVWVMGPLYCICALLMFAWNGYGTTGGTGDFSSRLWNQFNILWPTPIYVLTILGFWLFFVNTADIHSTARKYLVGSLHSLFHLAVILFGTAFVSTLVAGLKSSPIFGDIFYFFAVVLGMIALGFLGGFLWGSYLAVASYFWGDEPNNAFSAMRLDSYRHFLRLKLENDQITIYPIGVDQAPRRSDWKMNEELDDDNPHQDTPAIVPKNESLRQHLIESPIVIDLEKIKPLLL